MTTLDPFPSAIDFNHLFTAITNIKPGKHHSIIISFSRNLELSGLRPNMHSLGILTNCYCNLGRVDFAFSLLGKRLKCGYEPDIVIFTTLINGLSDGNYVDQAVKLLDKIVNLGFQPNIVTYGTIVKGLCRSGNNVGAINLLRKMQSDGICKPDVVIYTMIIDSLCKENLLIQAVKLLDEMQNEGMSPNAVTYSAVIRGCCDWGSGNDLDNYRS
ncbi:hypothetical protein BVRB_4g076490 [Beta vulgaris subsp. vulgaris]|uniref:Uncharacterized protein n=1 Tax=Beta vulgaris subsp. vulgaris TaxID=3555 RepID=A0A0J8FEP0_BETVV|nr:hypothetical protein BVRB_4g076490 [Beta vulgaris subsp. vulgaris]